MVVCSRCGARKESRRDMTIICGSCEKILTRAARQMWEATHGDNQHTA